MSRKSVPWILLILLVAGGALALRPASAVAANAEAESTGHEGEEKDLSLITVDPDLAIVTAIVFLILMAVLWKFAWGPIIDGLNKRESSIARDIDEAKAANEKAQATLDQYREKMGAAAAEVQAMLAEARREAEASKERIIDEAQQAAGRERDRAVADIAAAKNAALEEIAQKHVDQAFSLARRVIGDEIKPEDHDRLVRESVERFSNN